MDRLPMYILGYIPEVSAMVAVRNDVPREKFIAELSGEFGASIHGLNFNVFGGIHFIERKGNAFGRALYRYNAKGEGSQVFAHDKENEHLYALLHLAGIKATTEFMTSSSYWPRLLVWRLSESNDVANLLAESGIAQSQVIAA